MSEFYNDPYSHNHSNVLENKHFTDRIVDVGAIAIDTAGIVLQGIASATRRMLHRSDLPS
jgi:hypothetical protein